MGRKFFLGMLCFLLGCTSRIQAQQCELPPPTKAKPMLHNVQQLRKLHLDSRFTPEEVAVIKDAARAWVDASGGIVGYEIVTGYKFDPAVPPPNKILLLRLESSDPMTKKLGLEEEVTSGTMVMPGTVAIVFVVDRIGSKEALKAQVLRNLGTDLGLPSFRGKYPAVMNEEMDVSCPTKYDMILFCTRYVCDWKETDYCEPAVKNKVDKL